MRISNVTYCKLNKRLKTLHFFERKKILKINKRGVGIKISRVEKFQKINNRGGTIIRNLRVGYKSIWNNCTVILEMARITLYRSSQLLIIKKIRVQIAVWSRKTKQNKNLNELFQFCNLHDGGCKINASLIWSIH